MKHYTVSAYYWILFVKGGPVKKMKLKRIYIVMENNLFGNLRTLNPE